MSGKPNFLIWLLIGSLTFARLISTGCLPRHIKQVEDPNVPLSRPGYSMLPPGIGWYYRWEQSQAGMYSLVFGKRGDSNTHTFVALVTEFQSKTAFKNQEEFLSYVTNSRLMDTDPRRFYPIKEESILNNKFGPYCFRRYSETEDHGASDPGGTLPFLTMKTLGYFFTHPWIDNLWIEVAYSERGKADEISVNFIEVAQKIIDGFKITKEK